MTVPLTLLSASGKTRLTKRFTPQGPESYPNVKRVSSTTFHTETSADGLRQRFELLRENARYGHAMLRGQLKRELLNESRAQQTLTDEPNHTLLLDIDGWDATDLGLDVWPLDTSHVRSVAERALAVLPGALHGVSYIAHASSSFGRKRGKASVHIEFLLQEPMPTGLVKNWLRSLNLSVESIKSQLELTKNGHQLSWVIDPSVADNSKIIYIATPTFDGVEDPFAAVGDNRWVLVEKDRPLLDLRTLLTGVEPHIVNKDSNALVKELRKLAGLPAEQMKTKRITITDPKTGLTEDARVITNPTPCTLHLVRITETFAVFNVNDGDSNAYWCRLSHPDIIENFKGESPFLYSMADPEGFEAFIEAHTDAIAQVQNGTLVCMRNEFDSTYYYGLYDKKNDRFAKNALGGRQFFNVPRHNLEEAIASRGGVAPEIVPSVNLHFSPTTDVVWDRAQATVNLFEAPPLMRSPVEIPEAFCGLTYDPEQKGDNGISPYVQGLAPNTHKLIYHICGSDNVCYEHFINWLAFCLQRREISNTAWIFSGVQGTGKNMMFLQVIRPIWAEYSAIKTQKNFEDNFNGGMEKLLMCGIDEVKLDNSRSGEGLLATLKHMIASPTGTVRAMRTDQREAKMFCNFIMFTNQIDAVRIEAGDRRLNIATPQSAKLQDVYPEILKDITMIEREAPQFAAFLAAFKYDEFSARNPLENEAKMNMRVAASSSQDQFFTAITEKNLDFFIDLLITQKVDISDKREIDRVSSARLIVQSWAKDAFAEEETFVPTDDLRMVYLAIFPHLEMPASKFGSLVRKYGFNPIRKNLPNGAKPRGYLVRWKMIEHHDTPQVVQLAHSASTHAPSIH